MAMFGDQLRQVLRRLGRAPIFTVITLITLGIGVGANTVIFSVLEGVLLKPLPYPHPEQLIGVWHTAPGVNIEHLHMSPSSISLIASRTRTFEDIGVYHGDSVTVTGTGEPEQVRGMDVTDGTLPMLGVKPVLGRLFTREDDSPGSPERCCFPTHIGSQKFGGASSAIGRTITVDGKPREIIGVLPQGFQFLIRRCGADRADAVGSQQDQAGQLQLRGAGAAETGCDDGAGQRRHGAHDSYC